MSIFEAAHSPWPQRMLSVLRILASLVFITYGTMKLFNYPPLPKGMPPIAFASQMGLAGTLEVVGGLLMLIGLFTRPVAFTLSGEMAVAYFQFHYPRSFWPTENMGTPPILYCFIFLYLVFAGAGPLSVDAMIARAKAGKT